MGIASHPFPWAEWANRRWSRPQPVLPWGGNNQIKIQSYYCTPVLHRSAWTYAQSLADGSSTDNWRMENPKSRDKTRKRTPFPMKSFSTQPICHPISNKVPCLRLRLVKSCTRLYILKSWAQNEVGDNSLLDTVTFTQSRFRQTQKSIKGHCWLV